MIKNKIDFKLINVAIVALIIYLLYYTGNLWIGFVTRFISLVFPFFISFAVAYALHPFLKFLTEHRIPKFLGVIIILAVLVGVLALLGVLVFPLLFDQLNSLFNGIISFVKEMGTKYDFELGTIQTSLSDMFNEIIVSMGKYISDGALNIINVSLGYISTFLICFSAMVYFLIDMDERRSAVSKYLKKKSIRQYYYVKLLDNEMKSYLTGMVKVMFITLFEYSICYAIIGHPNAILLGFLAMLAGLIPYFGGIMVNIIAAITAFVISPALFIKTVITFVVLSGVDGYLINPLVYGKTNNVHPLIVIMSIFVGGSLFGVIGIMISFPVAVICITTIKFFKQDINEKIENYKENMKKTSEE